MATGVQDAPTSLLQRPHPVWLHSGHTRPAGTSTDHKRHRLLPAQTPSSGPSPTSATGAAEAVHLAVDEEAGLAPHVHRGMLTVSEQGPPCSSAATLSPFDTFTSLSRGRTRRALGRRRTDLPASPALAAHCGTLASRILSSEPGHFLSPLPDTLFPAPPPPSVQPLFLIRPPHRQKQGAGQDTTQPASSGKFWIPESAPRTTERAVPWAHGGGSQLLLRVPSGAG